MLQGDRFNHVNELLASVWLRLTAPHLKDNGPSPRGMRTSEVLGASFILNDCRRNILVNKCRSLNYQFMLAEWLWISLGRNDEALIGPYNKSIGQFSEDGTFRGAYGPKWIQQKGYVLDTLRADPDSRQAIVTLFDPRPRASKDVPCTLSLQYFIRNRGGYSYLDCMCTMRSNDAWLGLPYDIFTFTQLQQELALVLGVMPGEYHHHVGSLHLYETHWELAHFATEKAASLWAPTSELMTGMPHAFQAMFIGLTLMAGPNPSSVESWLNGNADWMGNPWGDYLRVLAYRFHKRLDLVPHFWQQIMKGDMDAE